MQRPALLTLFLLLVSLLSGSPSALASDRAGPPAGLDRLGEVAIQDGGRIMPLETYARRLAVQLTGRTHWSASRGPEAFAGKAPMELLCDLMFRGQDMVRRRLVLVEDRPFKKLVGLDETTRFFSPMELASCRGINDLLGRFEESRRADPQAQPSRDQRKALDIREAVERVASLLDGQPLAIIPGAPGSPFLRVGAGGGDPGTEQAREALVALGKAYLGGASVAEEVTALRRAIDSKGQLSARAARSVRLEIFADRHNPWLKTAVLYGGAIALFGLSRLMARRALTIAAIAAAGLGVAEHVLGIGLRVAILGRAPVSNTYESLLWMGLVGMAIGLVAQLANRRGYYLFAGVCAALVSVIFAGMMPLEDQTNSLPAVLRSNFWLTVHVLTIVASYGILAVAAVLGHIYLCRDVLFARRDPSESSDPRRSPPLIVQTYRTIQVGLVLLTAGTILGGVWAAQSWGRFWGWDPKETWALISILTYFAVLHARYVRWLRDFGLAAASVLGFVVIVWTFYGVNYVMATGLHSYGFGSGGELWVGVWALAEIAFLVACRLRYVSRRAGTRAGPPAASLPAAGQPRISGG